MLGVKGLEMGSGASVARDVVLDARAGLVLGPGSLIGFESVLLSWTHRWGDPTAYITEQGYEGQQTVVEEGSWLGARVFLLPGVRVGAGCVVGVGSVVTKSIPAGMVAAGMPAKPLRARAET